ncbi:hypothetical protein ABZ511_27580 [Nocardia gamkensis]|uniref:hypothetical protein n=1 Tax=Nocardia gamkensis TaxID=352869 RepID=UPI0033C1A882
MSDRVDDDLIDEAWQQLAYPAGRLAGTVDRAAYTFCLLEQFHRPIEHRNICVESSSKWRRAHLLTRPTWEAAREACLNALGPPVEPAAMLADHATVRTLHTGRSRADWTPTPRPQ